MLSITITLLSIAMVLAIDNSFHHNYERICKKLENSKLKDLLKYYRGDQDIKDCEHSLGFHFRGDLCPTPNKLQVSAFFSDSKRFFYVYTLLTDFNAVHSNEELKEWTFESKIRAGPKSLLVVWIKELLSKADGGSAFHIKYNDAKSSEYTIDFAHSNRIDDQVLLREFRGGKIIITISQDKSFGQNPISVAHSYIIECFSLPRLKPCRAEEKDQRVRCSCDQSSGDEIFMVYFLLSFVCIIVIIITKPVMEVFLEVEKKEKTMYHIYHNCSERTFKHKNPIILRLAKDTPGANLRHVTIDVEFFSYSPSGFESIGKKQIYFCAKYYLNSIICSIST